MWCGVQRSLKFITSQHNHGLISSWTLISLLFAKLLCLLYALFEARYWYINHIRGNMNLLCFIRKTMVLSFLINLNIKFIFFYTFITIPWPIINFAFMKKSEKIIYGKICKIWRVCSHKSNSSKSMSKMWKQQYSLICYLKTD